MTSVSSPLLKDHIARFNGSRGSGTDLGRTTVPVAVGLVKPATGSCPRANGERHRAKTNRAELPILRPHWVFKWRAFPAGRQTRCLLMAGSKHGKPGGRYGVFTPPQVLGVKK